MTTFWRKDFEDLGVSSKIYFGLVKYVQSYSLRKIFSLSGPFNEKIVPIQKITEDNFCSKFHDHDSLASLPVIF